MQREIASLQFLHGVHFELIDSLKKQWYLIVSDDSCEEFFDSRSFVDIAIAENCR